jgi:hypothetical protein
MEKEVKVQTSGLADMAAPNIHGGYKGKHKPAAAETEQFSKFEGKCDILKGLIFDCVDGRQLDRYNTNIKEVAEYVGRDNMYGGDVRWTIENEKICTVTMPEDIPAYASATKK